VRVAFLTYAAEPDLCADDRLAANALEDRAVSVVPWIWDGPPVGAVDAVIVRSCWDYHDHPDRFLAFLDALAAGGTQVLNDPRVVRWNIDKRYLLELARSGARIPRTVSCERGDPRGLGEVLDAGGFDEAVVKPRISLSAVDTFRASRGDLGVAAARFAELVARKPVLVQAFVPEIARGEISLVYLGGRFSHAILKTPRVGDFRVQVDHGGTRARASPIRAWLDESERVLAALPPLLYARVDVVDTAEGPVWMELEAIDPVLFFAFDPAAPARFADAFAEACRAGP
jgi:glutathione synthase/RimK-type ligase-like ATP-grasp enzyme